MRQLRLVAVAVVATLALTGCGDDKPDPGDANSTWTPSGTIETPSSSAPPAKSTEPPLPDAATKATKDGARAFITYYWDLVNYAQLTGDVKALKAVSGETCEGCQSGIAGTADHYASGGRVIGGYSGTTVKELTQLKQAGQDLYGFEARVAAMATKQTVIASDGSEETHEAGTETWAMYLIWVDDSWRVDILEHQ